MADDAVVADVLLGVSGLFMLLTSVTFALAVKVWVSWHNQKIGKKQHDEVDADSELHSCKMASVVPTQTQRICT